MRPSLGRERGWLVRREELEHLLRAAGDVLGETALVVIGSQAVLATAPEWELPPIAMMSVEADLIAFDDTDDAKADLVDGVLGEGSMFHETHGIYAQGVGFETIVAPQGWRDRLIAYSNGNTNGVTGWCLEIHDLWVAKMVAAREKDFAFCRALLDADLVDPGVLRDRIAIVPLGPVFHTLLEARCNGVLASHRRTPRVGRDPDVGIDPT